MNDDASTAGRPSKFTPEVCGRIIELVRKGLTYALACKGAGIDDSTLRKWRTLANDEPFFTFFTELQRAESEAAAGLVQHVVDAAPDDWKAAAWMLERRHPEDFAKRSALELTGKDGGPMQINAAEDLAAALAAAAGIVLPTGKPGA